MPSRDRQAAPAAASGLPRVDVLGLRVSAINMRQAVETIDGWIAADARRYVCVTGVHGVMECQRDPALLDIHNHAGLVTPDGMPLVWLTRWNGWRDATRVYGPDLLLAVCERSLAAGYRHFFYGGGEGVAERLVERLTARFPKLALAGTFTPPFRPLDEVERNEVIRRINDARPDIVWVGLGTPKQERWMAEHVGRLDAKVLIGVGAAFDFHAGVKRQAPPWMRESGLEWLFRLCMEPRRLWRRYLVNNPAFVALTLRQAWRTARSARSV